MRSVRLLLLLAALANLSGCRKEGGASEVALTIFAASSLTDAISELAGQFEGAHPGVEIGLHFAGSSQLAAQLQEGAVADLFAPASVVQMERLIAAGLVDAGAARPFVTNQLTLIVPVDNPAGLTELADLARPGLKLVLAAPGVPVRAYTDELVAAQTAAFQRGFYDNLVSEEENVRQVVAKIALGEADAGLVYRSDVTADVAGRLRQITIPEEQNVLAIYLLAPLNGAPEPDLARRFIAFALSDQGQAILASWGFGPPPAN